MLISSALAALALITNVIAYRHARAMLRFAGSQPKSRNPEELAFVHKLRVVAAGISNPRPTDADSPEAYGLRYERRSIPVDGSIRLGAWLLPHATPVGCVVLFHGYTASKSTLLLEANAFHQRGYTTLLIDFRGSADSSETYTTVGYREADDVKAVIEYVARELNCDAPILYARSMGAAAVLRAVAIHSVSARALILEGVFDKMLTTVKQRFYAMQIPAVPFAHLLVFWGGVQFGFWPFAHNPSAYARRCKLPVLMLHGSHDPRATLGHANAVFESLSGDKKLCVFDKAKHEQLLLADRERWNQVVDDFLNKFLAAPKGGALPARRST